MANNTSALQKRTIVEGLDIYVKRAELYRLPALLAAEDDSDDEMPLDYSFAPQDASAANHSLQKPTAFMVDGMRFTRIERSILEKSPFALIEGYPRFSSKDDQWITDMRGHNPDEELRGEVIIPHQGKGSSLLGVMDVYLQFTDEAV